MLELFGFKKTTHVGISLSANNFLELICIDKVTKNIVRYAAGNVKYNNAVKEVIDYEEFKDAVGTLFDEAGLDPAQCSVTVSFPNVHFAIMPNDENGDVMENLQEEVEDLYIFKKNEPSLSYVLLDGSAASGKQNVVYSAIQTKVVAKLIEIFDELGAQLVRVESSYSALLKAVKFHEKFSELFQKEEQTTIILISQTSCSSFYLLGDVITDYSEEPLAVKSFSPEEVHATISRIAEAAVAKNTSKSLLIISETDEVNAELLSQRIKFSGTIDYINKSVDVNDAFIDQSTVDADIDPAAIPYITIEAVGTAVADYDNYPLEINFLPPDRIPSNIVVIGPYEIDFLKFVTFCLVVAIICALLVVGLCLLFVNMQVKSMNESGDDNAREIKVFQEKISKSGSMNQKDMLPILTKILENNKNLIGVYSALATEISDTMYIKRFVSNEIGAIGILGEARTSAGVENFVNNLKEKDNSLMLAKLAVNSRYDAVPAVIPDGFTFEIKSNDKEISLQDDLLYNAPSTVQNIYNTVQQPLVQQGPVNRQPSGSILPPPSPII